LGKGPPPRNVFGSVTLPEDDSLPSAVSERFAGLPHLKNLRMLANVRNALFRSPTSPTRSSTKSKVDPRLCEIMYLRIAAKAAEKINADISTSHDTLTGLLDEFTTEGTSEIILLFSWFNIILYVEYKRVLHEPGPPKITSGSVPLALKS
jgi:hypothetical protein